MLPIPPEFTCMPESLYILYSTYIAMYIQTVHTYNIYGCIYTHACIHTYIHAYIHTSMHTYIYTYIHTYIHTCIHIYVHTYTHIFVTGSAKTLHVSIQFLTYF